MKDERVYLPGDIIPSSIVSSTTTGISDLMKKSATITSTNRKKSTKIVNQISNSTSAIVLGPGLQYNSNNTECIRVVQPGVLRRNDDNSIWLNVHSRRYSPTKGDRIIGVLTNKSADNYRIDIGAADLATISFLSFEGATKRNRPAGKVGELIYAQVHTVDIDVEPELICIDDDGKSHGLGMLPTDGFMFKCSLNLCRRLLAQNTLILSKLGSKYRFEITCGMNGRVWIKSNNHADTIAIMQTIIGAEYIDDEQIDQLITTVYDRIHQF